MTKKILFALIFTLTLTIFAPSAAHAMNSSPNQMKVSENEEISPMAEQTQWCYRVNEKGVYQKRLWSITRGIWLTEWIDVT